MKQIVFTGPESTGKSTIAEAVATHYGIDWVREYARIYLQNLGRNYQEKDLLTIAKGQISAEQKLIKKDAPFLVCDTSLLVLKIWSEFKYGRCHPWILKHLHQKPASLYFLCNIDIEWEYDPLREHPKQRILLFDRYRKELNALKIPYIIIRGDKKQRLKQVLGILTMYEKKS